MTKQEERYAAYQARRKKKQEMAQKAKLDLTFYQQDRYSKLVKTQFRTNIAR